MITHGKFNIASENLPSLRKGWSSKYHFSGAMLNYHFSGASQCKFLVILKISDCFFPEVKVRVLDDAVLCCVYGFRYLVSWRSGLLSGVYLLGLLLCLGSIWFVLTWSNMGRDWWETPHMKPSLNRFLIPFVQECRNVMGCDGMWP